MGVVTESLAVPTLEEIRTGVVLVLCSVADISPEQISIDVCLDRSLADPPFSLGGGSDRLGQGDYLNVNFLLAHKFKIPELTKDELYDFLGKSITLRDLIELVRERVIKYWT